MLVKLVIALPIVLFLGLLVFSAVKSKRNPTTCCTTVASERDARMH